MKKLSKRDINRAFNRWWWANEIPNNLDYLLGPSLLFALIPSLRKIYVNKDDLSKAYQRHLEYFNTQAIWGGATLVGIISNLEEAHSDQQGRDLLKDEVEVTDTYISMTKTGLMGVLAGVGDAVDSGTVQYIFITLALPWAFAGNWIGSLLPWIAFLTTTYIYGNYFALLGYLKGRMAAVELVSSKRFHMITEVLALFGLILLGYSAAQYIQINLNQNIINVIASESYSHLIEAVISLSLILTVYFYLSKKGLDLLKGMVVITILASVLLIFGIL